MIIFIHRGVIWGILKLISITILIKSKYTLITNQMIIISFKMIIKIHLITKIKLYFH